MAAGEKVDNMLGTVDNPGPTQWKFNANGSQQGKANSNGGAMRVLQEANPDADSLPDVSGSRGPVSVDEKGRVSIGIDGGAGASAGTDFEVKGSSFSIHDTAEAAKNAIEFVKDNNE